MKSLKTIFAIFLLVMSSNSIGLAWGGGKTLKKLVNVAPYIIVCNVLDVTCQSEKYLEQDNFIFTFVKLSVQTSLKGDNVAQTLTLKIPGGQIGDRVIGGERSHRFLKDERALLFLYPIDENYFGIYGISGKLSIIRSMDDEYCDCSLLQEDEISKYGYGSQIKLEYIVNRIKSYMAEKGGMEK
jgi:hypothetical protein